MSKFLSQKLAILLVISGSVVFFVFIFLFLWQDLNFDVNAPIKKEYFGLFGDIIGGVVGSLWALAGVILFYIALTEQRNDFKTNKDALEQQIEALNLQTKEFGLQRTELEQTRLIFQEQSNTLKKQQFESTFFAMLKVYNSIISSLNHNFNSEYFTTIKQKLYDLYTPDNDPVESHRNSIQMYVKFYFENKEDLSHYFKSLYRLVKFIYDSNLDNTEKINYAKLLRSQLRENEIFFLFYNAHTDYGSNFRPMILEYNLCKHLPYLSKLSFKNFNELEESSLKINLLNYYEWLLNILNNFLVRMKVNKFALLNEKSLNISIHNENLEAYFEFSSNSINNLNLKVHTSGNLSKFNEYLGCDADKYINFHLFLFHDIFEFSQFENNKLHVAGNLASDIFEFNIQSEISLKLIVDTI